LQKFLLEASKNYRVETAAGIKKKDLIDFFKLAYSDQFNAADYENEEGIMKRWEWANIMNPNIHGNLFPAWVCKDNRNNKIVGHCGLIPIFLKIKDICYPAAWVRDLIVPLKYRRSGIGSFLFDTVLKNNKDKFAMFLLAGTNDYGTAFYKKLGCFYLDRIPLFIRINRLVNILETRLHNRLLIRFLATFGGIFLKFLNASFYKKSSKSYENDEILVTQIQNFDNSFDKLWEYASSGFAIITKRDRDNLNWRFVKQPYWRYKIFKAESKKSGEIKGYVVLREGNSRGFRIGVISDLFAYPKDIRTIASLISFAVKFFEKKDNIDLVRCDILNKNFASILRKFGFISIPSNSHFMISNIRQNLDLNFAVNRNNWFIDYADSDLDLSAQK
jgi:GNAT superfamily N-acetyltransferase